MTTLSLLRSVSLALQNRAPAAFVKKNRDLLLQLAQEWNDRLRGNNLERTLEVLAQCVMKAVRDGDLPDVLRWATDHGLPASTRTFYILGRERFARKPGLARNALLEILNDPDVGHSAVWALAGAMRAEALPLLRKLRQSSPHDLAREAAAVTSKKIEARLRRIALPNATPAMLPQEFTSTTIEFNTELVPELLSVLEQGLVAQLGPGIVDQLALSANQLKRNQRRFHIVPLTFPSGTASQIGFGFCAEDEDVVVMGIHCDPSLRETVDVALRHFLDES